VCGDAITVSLNQTFDVVVAREVIEHIDSTSPCNALLPWKTYWAETVSKSNCTITLPVTQNSAASWNSSISPAMESFLVRPSNCKKMVLKK
jgi:hypothetical protein